MATWFTRRRAIGALVTALVIAALGGAVALRASKKAHDESGAGAAPVTLQFATSDLTYVEARPLSRWLPVSGTLQPVRQAIVKAKVAGDVKQITVREGETVRAGQVLARIDTTDLESRLVDRIGALESAKAQLALAEKTRAMNVRLLNDKFISQNAFDSSESSFNVARGSVKSAEAQLQLAQNALKDADAVAPLTGIVAKRHVQPGEKVAIEAPLVTVVDLTDLEVQALVPAVDVPELRIGMPVELSVDGFGDRRFTGRVERINPSTEAGTRAIMVYVALSNQDATLRAGMFATGRIALAASAAAPTLPLAAIRTEAGQNYVWVIDKGKLTRRIVMLGRRDETTGRVELRTSLAAEVPVLGAKFDNLKDGAPALVKAPTSSQDARAPKADGTV
ncbi:MAG TPA: efflux RND transporter periplasmic adaptor subunit [Casimicrobiaceae bacterium]|jgi:membrane fusion protein, multidrug efflux system|nr:efflux RND transporter periplasmic adaptor subunit [Casimicrobiaceae bacterium]